ncbi:MAG TPA: zf-HC2 domain-containing protein [Longimicrobiales bacterium]|nr:zf-HC2 domain-containing protein [Longimicrobiales bacterium]
MSRRVIDCDEALELLAAYLDGELSGEGHDAVEAHLEVCRSCFSRAEFESRLKKRLAELARGEPVPELEQRIRSLIQQFPAGAAPPGR